MNTIKYLLAGLYFGFMLIKSEAVSWYRIVEMFHFQSFHMYGIISTAIFVGALSIILLKKLKVKSLDGVEIDPQPKPNTYKPNLIGGILFGLGWSITGACTAPLYVLVGLGYSVVLIPIVAALIGALVFGLVKHKLPS